MSLRTQQEPLDIAAAEDEVRDAIAALAAVDALRAAADDDDNDDNNNDKDEATSVDAAGVARLGCALRVARAVAERSMGDS